jgi:hypothetical protein
MARYGASHVLDLRDVSVTGGALPVRDDDGLHVAAYVGDTDADGAYSANDTALLTNVLLRRDSGFGAYPLTDPLVLGNVAGNGILSGLDTRFLAQQVLGLNPVAIPPLPVLPATTGAPQPALAAAEPAAATATGPVAATAPEPVRLTAPQHAPAWAATAAPAVEPSALSFELPALSFELPVQSFELPVQSVETPVVSVEPPALPVVVREPAEQDSAALAAIEPDTIGLDMRGIEAMGLHATGAALPDFTAAALLSRFTSATAAVAQAAGLDAGARATPDTLQRLLPQGRVAEGSRAGPSVRFDRTVRGLADEPIRSGRDEWLGRWVAADADTQLRKRADWRVVLPRVSL